jgi:type IV secretory pathway VirB10-like protein
LVAYVKRQQPLAEQPVNGTTAKIQIISPQPYVLTQDTFINLALESTDPERVTARIYQNVYDHFENVALPKGSRLFGYQAGVINGLHNVFFTHLQLSDTGQILTLDPPLQATTPLGATGIVDFKSAAIAGAMLRGDLIIPH